MIELGSKTGVLNTNFEYFGIDKNLESGTDVKAQASPPPKVIKIDAGSKKYRSPPGQPAEIIPNISITNAAINPIAEAKSSINSSYILHLYIILIERKTSNQKLLVL